MFFTNQKMFKSIVIFTALNNPTLASQYPAFLQMAAAVQSGSPMTSPLSAAQATSQPYPLALNTTANTSNRIPPMYTIKSLLASPSQVDIERAKLMIKREGEIMLLHEVKTLYLHFRSHTEYFLLS